MFRYIVRRSIWEYKMFIYGLWIRHLTNRKIDMEIRREKEMEKYKKFKKNTKNKRSKLARYIHN